MSLHILDLVCAKCYLCIHLSSMHRTELNFNISFGINDFAKPLERLRSICLLVISCKNDETNEWKTRVYVRK